MKRRDDGRADECRNGDRAAMATSILSEGYPPGGVHVAPSLPLGRRKIETEEGRKPINGSVSDPLSVRPSFLFPVSGGSPGTPAPPRSR
jgi:hypothetical protein